MAKLNGRSFDENPCLSGERVQQSVKLGLPVSLKTSGFSAVMRSLVDTITTCDQLKYVVETMSSFSSKSEREE